jgi:cellulose synthase (UDP-forming)
MPNLEIFANAGFPFTQLADLAETTVVLPATPNAAEMALYFHLMGHFGAQTGYPALRVTVAGPNTVISPSRDYLILGTINDQPAINSLDAILPATLDTNGIHIKPLRNSNAAWSALDAVSSWWSKLFGGPGAEALPSNAGGIPDAVVEEVMSPSSPDRSIVLVALKGDSSADEFAGVLLDRSQAGDITGTVSLLRNSRFESYAINGQHYRVGKISWYALMRIWLTQHFLALLLGVTALLFVLANWMRGWLAQRARNRTMVAETTGVIEVPGSLSEDL